ncbi:MAG: hypothetical protein ABIE23_03945 [archaeon]|nr:hypothetical protein [Candidatus Micrarchaeota archaeon]
MNEKGIHLIFIILGLFLILAILPTITMWLFPQARIILQIILIFLLYSMVRSYLGSGILTIIISGILIYILVFKYPEFTAGAYILYVAATLMVSSVIIWGAAMFLRK